MAVTHTYVCSTCSTEVEVQVRLGDSSEEPVCPFAFSDDPPDSYVEKYGARPLNIVEKLKAKLEIEHSMKRRYKLGGAFIRW